MILLAGCAVQTDSTRGKGSVRWTLDDQTAALTTQAGDYFVERWAWKLSPQPVSRCPIIEQASDGVHAWERGLSK